MKTYVGTFLIAFATLALEITITRLLSVTGWYYLAFFAISTAMLGMTAGATLVYLKPQWLWVRRWGKTWHGLPPGSPLSSLSPSSFCASRLWCLSSPS